MSRQNGKPYVKYWVDQYCGHRQLRSDFCSQCGAPRPRDCKFEEPRNAAEMLLAEAAAADPKVFADAVNGIFCSHCKRRVPGDAKFCPGCGNPPDGSDAKPNATRGGKVISLKSLREFAGRRSEANPTPMSSKPAQPKVGATSASFAQARPRSGAVPTRSSMPVRSTTRSGVAKAFDFASLIDRVKGPVGGILVVSLCIGLIALFLWLNQTHEEIVTVAQNGIQYNGYVEISYIEVETGECWEGDCPDGYKEVSSSSQTYYPGGSSKVGEESQNVSGSTLVCEADTKVDCTVEVDGVVVPAVCTTPGPCEDVPYTVTQIVPVMAENTPYARNKISYSLDVKKKRTIETGWISGHNPQLPAYSLDSSKNEQFTGVNSYYYQILFQMQDGTFQYYDATNNVDLWQMLMEGQQVTANVTRMGTISSIVKP